MAKKPGTAEIYVAAIAAENVPGGGDDDVLQHGVAGEEQVVVADKAKRDEQRRGDEREDKGELRRCI